MDCQPIGDQMSEMTAKLMNSVTTPNVKESDVQSIQQHLAHTLNDNNINEVDITSQDMSQTIVTNSHLTASNASKVTQNKQREEAKRRRTRRSKKRKWQKLDGFDNTRQKRLQWSESTEQDVRRLHKKVIDHGQPLAPYNTTQFIMNDHNCDNEVDLDAIRGRLQRMRRNHHNDTTNDGNEFNNDEDFYSSPEDESDYLQQQFHETYDHIHAERLSSMNKNQLVEEYLHLEGRVEELEKRLKESTAQTSTTVRTTCDSEVQTERRGHDNHIDVEHDIIDRTFNYRQEIQRLSEENNRLRNQKEKLENILKERDH
ncbi:protein HEXIM1-like [Oppia nitens]|uniref:protein HEXIM1-like n=1 Tax=Oppia nitens TaxID=1686743 RepID=UPI0023DA57F9|nr:protein HEXIM1-like [Oppia nitens]